MNDTDTTPATEPVQQQQPPAPAEPQAPARCPWENFKPAKDLESC